MNICRVSAWHFRGKSIKYSVFFFKYEIIFRYKKLAVDANKKIDASLNVELIFTSTFFEVMKLILVL